MFFIISVLWWSWTILESPFLPTAKRENKASGSQFWVSAVQWTPGHGQIHGLEWDLLRITAALICKRPGKAFLQFFKQFSDVQPDPKSSPCTKLPPAKGVTQLRGNQVLIDFYVLKTPCSKQYISAIYLGLLFLTTWMVPAPAGQL